LVIEFIEPPVLGGFFIPCEVFKQKTHFFRNGFSNFMKNLVIMLRKEE